MSYGNVPDDWGCYFTSCRCGARYHMSEGGCGCMDDLECGCGANDWDSYDEEPSCSKCGSGPQDREVTDSARTEYEPLRDLDALEWIDLPTLPGWWLCWCRGGADWPSFGYYEAADLVMARRRLRGDVQYASVLSSDPIITRALPALRAALGAHVDDDDTALADAVVSLVAELAECREALRGRAQAAEEDEGAIAVAGGPSP